MASGTDSVINLYKFIIEDVITNVKFIFAEEGIDDNVLRELKTLWEGKSLPAIVAQCENASENTESANEIVEIEDEEPNEANMKMSIAIQPKIDKIIPVQVTVPMANTSSAATRILTINIPESSMNAPQIKNIITGPAIFATMGLPTTLAESLLQQYVNASLTHQQDGIIRQAAMPQLDGCDSDSSEDSIDSDTMMLAEDDDTEIDDNEAEPLNSGDDLTDDEPDTLFETDNVIVCQYEKIIRHKNKWRFFFKNGIMHLQGQDFVFQKVVGDSEW